MQRNHDRDIVRLDEVSHAYASHGSAQQILLDVSLCIAAGDTCAITGPSGSGKSTLLNLIGLLDEPLEGRLHLDGVDVSGLSRTEQAVLRNRLLGFVFQGFNLLPRLDALDNVALPLLYRGIHHREARRLAREQLRRVGLGGRASHRPAELSGGQRQRVAIARALIGQPLLLLADEPTGNLDGQTAEDIMDLLLSLNSQDGTTLLVVTHDPHIAGRLRRCLQVCEGRVEASRD